MSEQPQCRSGAQFTAVDLGPQSALDQYRFVLPSGAEVPGKIFLRRLLGASGVEISWGSLPPGRAIPFLHAHQEHEEIYLCTGGAGEFEVDGEIFAIGEGSVVRVAPAGKRGYRNTGATPLTLIVLQVRPGTLSAGPIEDGVLLEDPPVWAQG